MAGYPKLDSRKDALAEWLCRQAGSKIQVNNLKPLAGGASQELWGLDLQGLEGGPLELVLRADAGGTLLNSLTKADEFRLLEISYKAGVTVPKPYWLCEDTEVIGRSFYVTARVKGEAIGRKIVRDKEFEEARQVLPAQMARELARIHSINQQNSDLEFLARLDPAIPVNASRRLYMLLDHFKGEFHPALELGLRWLVQNAPPLDQPVLVHGDFRIGNLMVGPKGLTSVLDWELSHLGDPAEDLAWPQVRFWRFGNNLKRVGGIAGPAALFEAYEKETGKPVDRKRVHYWEVMGNAKWALGARQQADRFLSGAINSLELASIGRRIPEMELELLDLIERGPAY